MKIKNVFNAQDPTILPLKSMVSKLDPKYRVIWTNQVVMHVLSFCENNEVIQKRLDSAMKFLEGKRSSFHISFLVFRIKLLSHSAKDEVSKEIVKAAKYSISSILNFDDAINTSLHVLQAINMKDGYQATLKELQYQFKLLIPIIKQQDKEKNKQQQ